MRPIYFIILISTVLFSVDCAAQKTLVQDIATIFAHGDLVSSNDGTLQGTLSLSSEAYDGKIVGVYVSHLKQPASANGVPVLIPKGNIVVTEGIVKLKCNSENGQIRTNDPLTASSVPGVAMKATNSGVIIGIAMEDATVPSGLISARILIQYLKQ